MLADCDVLRSVPGTNLSCQELGLPARTALVETVTDPKYTLNEIVRKINVTRSRRRPIIKLSTKYEALARQIDLNKLLEVPAYKEFVYDLAKTLEELHFIPYGSADKVIASAGFPRYRR